MSERFSWVTLLRRNLAHFKRSHVLTLFGCVVAATVITGSLIVGDSVRGSLRTMALKRLGPFEYALFSPDRFFKDDLGTRMALEADDSVRHSFHALVQVPGVAAGSGDGPVSRAMVFGVDIVEWPSVAGWKKGFSPGVADEAFLNSTLAAQLKVNAGDELVLRVPKAGAAGLDAVVTSRDTAVGAMRLRIVGVLSPDELGDFGLRNGQAPPANIFVQRSRLQAAIEQPGRANLMVAAEGRSNYDAVRGFAALSKTVTRTWRLEDAGVIVRAPTNSRLDPLLRSRHRGYFWTRRSRKRL
jgi:hypothetical protein